MPTLADLEINNREQTILRASSNIEYFISSIWINNYGEKPCIFSLLASRDEDGFTNFIPKLTRQLEPNEIAVLEFNGLLSLDNDQSLVGSIDVERSITVWVLGEEIRRGT